MPFHPRQTVAALCSAAALAIATPAQAQDTYLFDGSKVRVNMSNTLTMLTQEISAAACNVKTGIDVAASQAELEAARNDFRLILDGLENGSAALGIPSEERKPRILRNLSAVNALWDDVDAALNSNDPADIAQAIAISQDTLYEAASILASEILNAYSNPFEMTQRDAYSLNFAGRQRQLGFQMARAMCGIASGDDAIGTVEDLDEYASLFEVSLGALQNGMPQVGVQPPPSELVTDNLTVAQDEWSKVAPLVQATIETGSADQQAIDAINTFVSDTKLLMGNTVTLYMFASSTGEEVYKVALDNYAATEVPKWLEAPILIEALRAQNAEHASLTQADVDELDLIWRAQMKEGGGPLVSELVERPLSDWFRERVDATAGLVVEIFATDNIGLNVGQSGVTGDYWQGDELKYTETIKYGQGTTHFGEAHLDVENGVYQAQISAPVQDPDTGEWIGVMIFSVNVQALL